MLLPPSDTFEDLCRDFRWDIPDDFNIGRVGVRRLGGAGA